MLPKRPDSGKRVLPPISSDGEKQFIRQLEQSLQDELSRLDPANPSNEERYSVHKNCFSEVIERVSAYKPLLTAIKAEYESCIETIERGQKEAFFLSGKVKAMAAEQNTLTLYQKRAEELENKIEIVKADNRRLTSELEAINETIEKKMKLDSTCQENDSSQPRRKPAAPRKHIPGLSLEESTDIPRLKKELADLEAMLENVKQSRSRQYQPRWRKDELKQQLASKSKAKDHVSEQNIHLKSRSRKLHAALDALRAYYRDDHGDMSPAEFVTLALTTSASNMSLKSHETGSTFEDDDPTKEREAELLLDYIDQFNDLFEGKQFADAAMHAANSPRGILRNPETLARFKGVLVNPGDGTPLLMYCEALMASVHAVGVLPDAGTSLECVKAALYEDRLDLITHWLARNRLTYSEPLGHLLYNYTLKKSQDVVLQCLPLAQAVYMKVGAHIQAAVCMCRQGKIHAMVEYARMAKFTTAAYLGVLAASPSVPLAERLIRSVEGAPLVSFGTVVSKLLTTEHHHIGLELLERLQSGTLKLNVKDAVFKDERTTLSTWNKIIRACQETGLQKLALELLAAVTVLKSIHRATADLDSEM